MAARWAHNPKVVGSNPTPATKLSMWHTVFFSLGGKSAMDPPVPIPNTEVKLRSADDTASARVWENRALPGDYFCVKAHGNVGFLFGRRARCSLLGCLKALIFWGGHANH